MPLIRVETNESLSPETKTQLCASLSRIGAEVIGKPEAYVMAVVADRTPIMLGGKPGPAAFVDVRSIGGLTSDVNGELSGKICALITSVINVSGGRIYLNFTELEASHWGHNGSTFG